MSSTPKQSPAAATLAIYWSFLRHRRKALIGCLAALPVCIITQNGLLPVVYSRIIDHLQQSRGHIAHFEWWLAGFIGLHLIIFVGQRVTARYWSRLEHRIIKDIEQHIFARLMGQSNHFHATRHAGGLVAQAKRFTGSFSGLMGSFYYNLYALVVRIVVAFAILLFVAPLIAVVLLAWTGVYLTSILWLTKKKMHASEAAAAADSRMTAHLADTIGNAPAVKIFGSEHLEGSAYAELSHDKYLKRRRDWWLTEFIFAWQGILMIVLEVVVLVMSVQLVQSGAFTIGKLALVQFFMAPILASLWGIADIFRRVETCFSEAVEMTQTLALEPAVKDPLVPAPTQISRGGIEFKDVCFQYKEGLAGRQIFDNLNLYIKPGQKVGVVGPSGSGKSSLTKLLLRFMDVDSGHIVVDGQNIAELRQADLRHQIAFVPQEPQLFHRTIRENIYYSKPGASDEEVVQAAKQAHAHDFIMKLPRGYDTMVGERGSKLSGGERQRIAIARAMLKNAPIVVLDEATSALDSESEKLIQKAFATLIEGRTAIIIAHRLSTIQQMDRIIVLKDGAVLEDGPHHNLLEQKGLYAELWQHQAGGAAA
ncbi:MAG TPA: ABC transporter ATP-binding protein [Candidatus Limnocylindrales bacterium]|nr:ABC transporter ATP-binding protein [Candidatus Limnocylindrales bacterium]